MSRPAAIKFLSLCCLLFPLNAFAQGNAFNLEDWPKTRPDLKPMYVKAIMEQAGVHKVSFKLPAEFYIAELDKFSTFAAENNYRPYLKTSVAQNLATLAVIHCDWNNGVPPWEFAQKYLGDKQIELLKTPYATAIARLQNNCAE
ncbi:hypothetical protein [Cellvibrio mixtus]|uniref:hypothetical protein n=1 Tax=Cellvibrio mixtus TaxID=39650 RepID=UPI000587CC47|nr:hypothetical protein [Cellvibrio mixtus]